MMDQLNLEDSWASCSILGAVSALLVSPALLQGESLFSIWQAVSAMASPHDSQCLLLGTSRSHPLLATPSTWYSCIVQDTNNLPKNSRNCQLGTDISSVLLGIRVLRFQSLWLTMTLNDDFPRKFSGLGGCFHVFFKARCCAACYHKPSYCNVSSAFPLRHNMSFLWLWWFLRVSDGIHPYSSIFHTCYWLFVIG